MKHWRGPCRRHRPEVNVNVYDPGLIYEVLASDRGDLKVRMTTSACPDRCWRTRCTMHFGVLPEVREVEVELVWVPPWSPERMSEVARQQLGW
ncbi:aromatic ring hydroxylase [Thiohalomonas denitrificans]|uniref:Metal-sulfur cluster biosynthetic enzyme n=1 Tax=Thiohalomonas denitrificans TaxID=415747 RepID=A0A1G5QK90_9GAMM|nr:aromatic ring hydroxylase [Thiohalomonas denitrificans]SCZ62132.1 Metal-sulfur cluster biosynthetic enzyme [Thiohalomonas denitrificans]